MEELVKKQFVVTSEQHQWLEDEALRNKRSGNRDLDSISKIARTAIQEYRENPKKKKPGK